MDCSSSGVQLSRSVPSKIAVPRSMIPGGWGIRPSIDMQVTDLPRAGLANDAECLALVEVERHAVHGTHHTVARVEVRCQIVDLK